MVLVDKEEDHVFWPSLLWLQVGLRKPENITRKLNRLEKKNIVKRAPSDADRRSVVVTLTDQGRALYPEIRPLIVDVLNHLLRGFSQAEVKQLENLLLRVLHNA